MFLHQRRFRSVLSPGVLGSNMIGHADDPSLKYPRLVERDVQGEKDGHAGHGKKVDKTRLLLSPAGQKRGKQGAQAARLHDKEAARGSEIRAGDTGVWVGGAGGVPTSAANQG